MNDDVTSSIILIMSIPVRCHSCGVVLGTTQINKAAQNAKTKDDFVKLFKQYGIRRYCCKTVIMSYVPAIEKLTH